MAYKGIYSSVKVNITVEGTDELLSALSKVKAKVVSKAAEQVLLAGARTIANDMRRRAPVGPTGNLKRSVVAKTLQSNIKPRSALAGIDRRKGGYHAHLIEYGTSQRYQKTTGRYTGIGTARPFVRPAIDTNKERVQNEVIKGFEKIIDTAWG